MSTQFTDLLAMLNIVRCIAADAPELLPPLIEHATNFWGAHVRAGVTARMELDDERGWDRLQDNAERSQAK